MKFSEVNINDIKDYTNIFNNEDDKLLNDILISSKSYIKNYTGLTEEQCNLKEDLTIALLALCTELYDNRAITVKENKLNYVINTILNMHSINLL